MEPKLFQLLAVLTRGQRGLAEHVDAIYRRLGALEQRDDLAARIAALEEQIADLERQVRRLREE